MRNTGWSSLRDAGVPATSHRPPVLLQSRRVNSSLIHSANWADIFSSAASARAMAFWSSAGSAPLTFAFRKFGGVMTSIGFCFRHVTTLRRPGYDQEIAAAEIGIITEGGTVRETLRKPKRSASEREYCAAETIQPFLFETPRNPLPPADPAHPESRDHRRGSAPLWRPCHLIRRPATPCDRGSRTARTASPAATSSTFRSQSSRPRRWPGFERSHSLRDHPARMTVRSRHGPHRSRRRTRPRASERFRPGRDAESGEMS